MCWSVVPMAVGRVPSSGFWERSELFFSRIMCLYKPQCC